MRRRGELVERSFAHVYDTGGMRRTHLRGHTNILKRLLIHAGAFNLGLVMRQLIGLGTPRGLQGRRFGMFVTLGVLLGTLECWTGAISVSHRLSAVRRRLVSRTIVGVNSSATATFATDCRPDRFRAPPGACMLDSLLNPIRSASTCGGERA
jgi:hypothetical protein